MAAQRADPGSLFHFYKALIALRNTRPSVARGSFEAAAADGLVLQFQRALGDERTWVVLNYGTQPARVGVPAGWQAGGLFPAGTTPSGGVLEVPAQSVRVLALRR